MPDMTIQAIRAHDYGGPDVLVLEQASLFLRNSLAS